MKIVNHQSRRAGQVGNLPRPHFASLRLGGFAREFFSIDNPAERDKSKTCPAEAGSKIENVEAFTLIELMLVVAIIGVVAAITMPYMVKSIRGNRLRTAARTVVSAGRYARSMAVMRQKDVYLTFNIEAGKIEVTETPPAANQESKEAGELEKPAVTPGEKELPVEEPPAEGASDSGIGVGMVALARTLDRVAIERVETEEGGAVIEGIVPIAYRRNGRCTPYSVALVDEHGKRVLLKVDALSCATSED